jgi:hypothetical protein
MRNIRSLRFDALEARKLLSRVHAAVSHHPAQTESAGPVVLDGTLTVDSKGSSSLMNGDGSSTNTVPVSGHLATLGTVRGAWSESVDQLGNPTGIDVLRLHNASGTVIVAFNNLSPAKPQRMSRGVIAFEHPQRLELGAGTYAGASESGTIDVVTNAATQNVKSLVLHTQNP